MPNFQDPPYVLDDFSTCLSNGGLMGEYLVHPPGLAEHGPEGQGETDRERPRLSLQQTNQNGLILSF